MVSNLTWLVIKKCQSFNLLQPQIPPSRNCADTAIGVLLFLAVPKAGVLIKTDLRIEATNSQMTEADRRWLWWGSGHASQKGKPSEHPIGQECDTWPSSHGVSHSTLRTSSPASLWHEGATISHFWFIKYNILSSYNNVSNYNYVYGARLLMFF